MSDTTPVEEVVDRGDVIEEPVVEVTPEEIEAVVPAAAEEPVAEAPKEELTIPKARFDEAREQAKLLQAELEAAKQQLAAQVPSADIQAAEQQIGALYDQYAELAADMKFKEAAAALREARRIEGEIEVYKAAQFSVRARDEALDRVSMNSVIDKMEAQYDVINPNSDKYDQSVVDEIKELQGLYASRGISATAALQKASKYVLAPYNQVAPETKKEVGLERQSAAKAKAARAATSQPASADAVGLGSDKSGHTLTAEAIMSMSQDQFAKLGEDALAKLRGDTL
jgi:hypothetical protein